MRKFLCALAIAGMLPLAGCTQSVERAQQDVRQAQDQATENVREEQRDLQETKRDAAERVARQERRVQDAAREGNKEIIEEKRDVEDAKRAEERRELNDIGPVSPRTNDRSATTPADPPTRVDVNINRGPGTRGVDVDVNRNP